MNSVVDIINKVVDLFETNKDFLEVELIDVKFQDNYVAFSTMDAPGERTVYVGNYGSYWTGLGGNSAYFVFKGPGNLYTTTVSMTSRLHAGYSIRPINSKFQLIPNIYPHVGSTGNICMGNVTPFKKTAVSADNVFEGLLNFPADFWAGSFKYSIDYPRPGVCEALNKYVVEELGVKNFAGPASICGIFELGILRDINWDVLTPIDKTPIDRLSFDEIRKNIKAAPAPKKLATVGI